MILAIHPRQRSPALPDICNISLLTRRILTPKYAATKEWRNVINRTAILQRQIRHILVTPQAALFWVKYPTSAEQFTGKFD
jgi:hypothetical protein